MSEEKEKVLEGEYIPADEPEKVEPSKASCRPDFFGRVPGQGPVIKPMFVFTVPAATPTTPTGAASYNPGSVYFKDKKV